MSEPWIENVPGCELPENGQRIEVQLHGDDEIYVGTVIKARKLWTELDDHPAGKGYIAAEDGIRRWRRLAGADGDSDPVRALNAIRRAVTGCDATEPAERTTRMSDLLPCPFCGGAAAEAPAHPSPLVEAGGIVRCTICGAQTRATDPGEKVGDLWNRRSSLAPAPGADRYRQAAVFACAGYLGSLSAEDRERALDAAAAVIARVAAEARREYEPRWISVEERLPNPGSEALVLHASGRRSVAIKDGMMVSAPGGGRTTWWSQAAECASEHAEPDPGPVTHWMPLPEPPA